MKKQDYTTKISFTSSLACLLSILFFNIPSVFAQTDPKVTISLQTCTLGNIEEGETKTYDKKSVPNLDSIIQIRTTKANVSLLLESNLDTLKISYFSYNITIKYSIVPSGSKWSNGETICTMSLSSPDQLINLDVAGLWVFEAEIATTAKSLSSDCPTIVNITITVSE